MKILIVRVEPDTPYKGSKFMCVHVFRCVLNAKKSAKSHNCTTCGNNAFSWGSQLLIFGMYPAGDMLLSSEVLMAGVSFSKVLLVMRLMGL